MEYKHIFIEYKNTILLQTSNHNDPIFLTSSRFSTVCYTTALFTNALNVGIPSENFQSFLIWLSQVADLPRPELINAGD